MTNQELADVFALVGDLLEIKGEIVYKTLAYRKAAESLSGLGRDVNDIWKEGGQKALMEIPGVGKAIAEKIDELLQTGKLEYLEKVKKEVPAELAALLQIPDLGPKKVGMFYRELGILTIDQLKEAAQQQKLRDLPGMGEKSEAKILAGIEALSRRSGRLPLGTVLPFAEELRASVRKMPGVKAAELAGSLRRMRHTVGDIDLLVAARNPETVIAAFAAAPNVARVTGQGTVKAGVEFHNGMRAQIWVHQPERFGTALQYATGSKEHNVRLREMALDKDLSLSDQSFLRKDGTELLCATEAEVYHELGMPWIPPEIREDSGEIQAALNGVLPKLIEVKNIRADLHCHSTWSDGQTSIAELAKAAKNRGYKTLAITDHSPSIGLVNGLSIERLREQRKEIEKLRKKLGDSLLILHGVEVEIKADGKLDYPDDVLEWLDIVIASLHVSIRQPRAQVTERVIAAMRNPHVDIIGHPSNRMLPDREGADLDWDAVLKAAAETGTALEINANPRRLDLDDVQARRAIDMGIKLSVNTDAHHPDHMDFIAFGVATARRGWVTAPDVINAWTPKQIKAWLKD
ncbi:MAG TPA: DNA polymerase/3'-5' exonuclease PolX [Anaerolineales bacterium]|nr:DNA polymerase/3'-5' exonuclease PolX [Anaerolineales bacterium]